MTYLWRSCEYVVPLFLIVTVIVCIITIGLARRSGKDKVVEKKHQLLPSFNVYTI